MAGRAPGIAPAPGLALGPSLLTTGFPPSPSIWQSGGPDYGLSLPVTKIVTVCLFVAAVLGFIMIALFITFNFYRRRALLQRRMAMLGHLPEGASGAPRREIPIHEGFIVANPCGEEQVAYKLSKAKETELTEVIVDSGSESETDLSGRCSANTSLQTSPEQNRSAPARTSSPGIQEASPHP